MQPGLTTCTSGTHFPLHLPPYLGRLSVPLRPGVARCGGTRALRTYPLEKPTVPLLGRGQAVIRSICLGRSHVGSWHPPSSVFH